VICQSCVVVFLVPARTTWLLAFVMTTLVLVKVAVQPWSHKRPTDRSDPVVSDGNMWHWLADRGRFGMSSVAECVDDMMLPSGRETCNGLDVGTAWLKGPLMVR
jgi:hypothetical protein